MKGLQSIRRSCFWLFLGLALSQLCFSHSVLAADPGCLSCHTGYTSPIPGKGNEDEPACTFCHGGDGRMGEVEEAHKGLIPNPSALDVAPRTCGSCHPGWPQRVALTPMATAVGVINQTRYLWGAQPDSEPRYGVGSAPGLMTLPTARESRREVDDFLRRRCLRCHLWIPGEESGGARRAAGCAACHVLVDDGGKPTQGHKFSKKVPVSQCLHCHAGCGAGSEYAGRIPRDDTAAARFLAGNPARPELFQTRTWRPMQPDLHYAAGMACQDCHPRSEIMGDGKLRPAALDQVGVRCASCHGGFSGPPPQGRGRTSLGSWLENLRVDKKETVLTGKLDGKERRVPPFLGGKEAPVSHRVAEHGRVACHACHSASNPADWGTMCLLETRNAYEQWADIAVQGDPQFLNLMARELARPPERRHLPTSRDLLDGREEAGVWILSTFFRRFEWRVYGRGPQGRVFLLAPRFQYLVTRLPVMDPAAPDPLAGQELPRARTPVTIDGRPGLSLLPWHPHTTAKATAACADCHGRARVLGLGLTFRRERSHPYLEDKLELAPSLWRPDWEGLNLPGDWTRAVDLEGVPLMAFPLAGSRPFNREEILGLLKPGKAYTRWLLEALDKEDWPAAEGKMPD